MDEHGVDFYRREIPAEIIGYIPPKWARHLGMIPIELGTQNFIVATTDAHPNNIDMVRFLLNRPDIEIVQVSPEALQFALDRYYPHR
jgi:cadmium resistance protein CadD (predicted permease)